MQRAIAAYHRGDWTDAEKLCRVVLDANADHSDALHLLGTLAVQTQRPHEAAELLARAAAINPGNAEIHNTRGVALRDIAGPGAGSTGGNGPIGELVPDGLVRLKPGMRFAFVTWRSGINGKKRGSAKS